MKKISWIRIPEHHLKVWNELLSLLHALYKQSKKQCMRMTMHCEAFNLRILYTSECTLWFDIDLDDDIEPFMVDVHVEQFATLAAVSPKERDRAYFGMDKEKNQLVFKQGKSKTSIGVMDAMAMFSSENCQYTEVDGVLLEKGLRAGMKYTNKHHAYAITHVVFIDAEDAFSLSFFAADGHCLIHENIRMRHALPVGEKIAVHVDLIDALSSFLKMNEGMPIYWSIQKSILSFYTGGCVLQLPRVDTSFSSRPFLAKRSESDHIMKVNREAILVAMKRIKTAASIKEGDRKDRLPLLLCPQSEKRDRLAGDEQGVFDGEDHFLVMAVFGETFESIQSVAMEWVGEPMNEACVVIEQQFLRCIQSIDDDFILLRWKSDIAMPVFVEGVSFEEKEGPLCMMARTRAVGAYVQTSETLKKKMEEQ